MNFKWLASILLTAGIVTSAFAQDNWDKYAPRTMKQLTMLGKASFKDPDFEVKDHGRVVMVLSANTFPSLATVTYTGQSRAVSAKKKEVIATWLKVFRPQDKEYLQLFDVELLFSEGKDEYWLPVQTQVIPFFERELKKGDSVRLYLVWVGGRQDSDMIEHVFLVNEFDTEAANGQGQ